MKLHIVFTLCLLSTHCTQAGDHQIPPDQLDKQVFEHGDQLIPALFPTKTTHKGLRFHLTLLPTPNTEQSYTIIEVYSEHKASERQALEHTVRYDQSLHSTIICGDLSESGTLRLDRYNAQLLRDLSVEQLEHIRALATQKMVNDQMFLTHEQQEIHATLPDVMQAYLKASYNLQLPAPTKRKSCSLIAALALCSVAALTTAHTFFK